MSDSINLEDFLRWQPAASRSMIPSHPGVSIRMEAVAELGLSVAAAARIPVARRATVPGLQHGKAAVSPETALLVEKAFGVSMDLLLSKRAGHDSARMHEIAVSRQQPSYFQTGNRHGRR